MSEFSDTDKIQYRFKSHYGAEAAQRGATDDSLVDFDAGNCSVLITLDLSVDTHFLQNSGL